MPTLTNILLVYPEVPANTFWSLSYALAFIDKKSALPPLGLITVAALMPAGFNVRLVDMNIEPLEANDIQWADAVFVSAMIVQQASFQQVVDTCRQWQKPVIAGGPYPTSSWSQIQGIDHFILGEVETTLAAFFDDFAKDKAHRVYPADGHPSLELTPPPRFDLLNLAAYGSMSVQYSRGCPFHCEFCDIWNMFGNRPRLKSATRLIAELDALFNLGWRGNVFVVDDNFIGNRRRVKTELLPALIRWQRQKGYPFLFYTEASINLADDEELLAGMREAGFNQVFIGIETPSPACLAETGKTQNLQTDMTKAVHTIQRHGLEVMGGFILGFDSDTEDIFDRQIDFIQQTGIVKAMIGLLNALPGTRLYQRLAAEGRLLGGPSGNNTHETRTNFITRMDPETLRQGYLRVLSTLYDYRLKNYFARCNRLLDRIENSAFFQRRITFAEVRAVARSLVRQPFTPYGGQYLKFLARNLVKNTHILGEAMALAIEGHHFHMITQQGLKADAIIRVLDDTCQSLGDLLERCTAQTAANSRVTVERLKALWTQKQDVLNQVAAQINGLHRDFRAEIERHHAQAISRLKQLSQIMSGDTTAIPSRR